MTGTLPTTLLDAAIRAALDGGRAIMEVYATPFEVYAKADRSPLTEADRNAHTAIEDVLAATGLPVHSEEGRSIAAEVRQAWPHYWLVDPLDGTKEFVARNDEFAVCIALMRSDTGTRSPLGNAEPLAGVVYAPVTDVLYFAWKGGGAYRQNGAATHRSLPAYERAAMSTRLPLAQPAHPFTILASRSHRSPDTEAYIARMEQQHGRVALSFMGSAIKFGLLAEGAADTYPRYAPTMEWDTAAGQVICSESGKQLIDITTSAPMRYNKNELVNNWFIVE